MCGIAGYSGLGYLSVEERFDLVEALGSGIDTRGGHAAGAVIIPDVAIGEPRLIRKLGRWDGARGRFLRAASAGHSLMMHARWATHGAKDDIKNAHPFAVKRTDITGKEVTALYGCHNGVLDGTYESAKEFKREHTVDSLELLELLADSQYELIRKLRGYGVVTFVRPDDRLVRVFKLTDSADFNAVSLPTGGLVWASTWTILREALEYIGVKIAECNDVGKIETGRVYRLSGPQPFATKIEGLVTQARTFTGGWSSKSDSYDNWDDSYLDATERWLNRNSHFTRNPGALKVYGKPTPPLGNSAVNVKHHETLSGEVGHSFHFTSKDVDATFTKQTDGTYRKTIGGVMCSGWPFFCPTTGGKYDRKGRHKTLVNNWNEGLKIGIPVTELRNISIGILWEDVVEKVTPMPVAENEVVDNGFYSPAPPELTEEEKKQWDEFMAENGRAFLEG